MATFPRRSGALHGGDPASFRAGVLAALAALVASGPRDAHVAVFTHGLPINVVLSHALGLARIVHFPPGTAR
jgi:probable phosphoglycerate mutase